MIRAVPACAGWTGCTHGAPRVHPQHAVQAAGMPRVRAAAAGVLALAPRPHLTHAPRNHTGTPVNHYGLTSIRAVTTPACMQPWARDVPHVVCASCRRAAGAWQRACPHMHALPLHRPSLRMSWAGTKGRDAMHWCNHAVEQALCGVHGHACSVLGSQRGGNALTHGTVYPAYVQHAHACAQLMHACMYV